MKSLLFFGLIYLVILPLIALGCDKIDGTITPSPATTNPGDKVIAITLYQFSGENSIIKDIEINKGNSLTIKLESNASTGYEWQVKETGTPEVIVKASESFIGPQDKNIVGSSGTDVWVYDAVNPGTATITMNYLQPWKAGDQKGYTLTINVTVK